MSLFFDIYRLSPMLALQVLDEIRADITPKATAVPGSKAIVLTDDQARDLWGRCGTTSKALLRALVASGSTDIDGAAVEAAVKAAVGSYDFRMWGGITRAVRKLLGKPTADLWEPVPGRHDRVRIDAKTLAALQNAIAADQTAPAP